jgi:lysophospholipase L1-like esterase
VRAFRLAAWLAILAMYVPPAAMGADTPKSAKDAVSAQAFECTAPADVTRFKADLPNTARAIRQRKPLTIVAIGSSSTEGVGASLPENAYPAQLAIALKVRWPDLDVRVVNKGVGGEDAAQMLARFATDVLPYKPQLVIWQVGSNYALRSTDLDAYAAILRKGINRLRAADTDVILMDLQYAPMVLEKPVHRRMVDRMRALANDLKVAIFRRFAIMRHWVTSGRYDFEDIVTRDRLHMNDASYGCIGELLADSVAAAARAVRPSPATGASAGRDGAGSR